MSRKMNKLELMNLEYFKEVRISSRYVPPCGGKPKGHSIELFVTRVPGAFLYRRSEHGKNETWTVQGD